jgi:hypothetical protein
MERCEPPPPTIYQIGAQCKRSGPPSRGQPQRRRRDSHLIVEPKLRDPPRQTFASVVRVGGDLAESNMKSHLRGDARNAGDQLAIMRIWCASKLAQQVLFDHAAHPFDELNFFTSRHSCAQLYLTAGSILIHIITTTRLGANLRAGSGASRAFVQTTSFCRVGPPLIHSPVAQHRGSVQRIRVRRSQQNECLARGIAG